MTSNFFELTIILLINFISLFLIIIALSNTSKAKLNKAFVQMTIFLIAWINLAYLGSYEHIPQKAVIFYKYNWVSVIGFLFSAYIFYVKEFLQIKYKYLTYIILFISSIFIYLTIYTDSIIADVSSKPWGNEIIFGSLNIFYNLYAVLMAGIFLYYLISQYKFLSQIKKHKINYFLIGTILFLIFNLIFNVLSPILLGTTKFQQYGDYSAIIFLLFTALAILQHNFLGAKLVLPAFLISIIETTLFINVIFFNNTILETSVSLIILIIFTILSSILIRSILTESNQTTQLQQTLDKERDMLDILGHELRTPMSIARNAISLLKSNIKKDTLTDEKLNKYVDMAYENIRRETKLLETMLSTAKLDKGDIGLNLEKVDLNDVVNDSLEGLTKKANDKGLQLSFNPKEQIYIYVDRTRIQEVVDNLIDNAIKYTKKGSVNIEIYKKDDKNAIIKIVDTGIGIPQKDLPNLGQKFFRVNNYLDSSQKDNTLNVIRPGGTGLGLYVTTNLIKAMNGTFDVHSEVEKGSTFTLIFPLFLGQSKDSNKSDIIKLDKIATLKQKLANK